MKKIPLFVAGSLGFAGGLTSAITLIATSLCPVEPLAVSAMNTRSNTTTAVQTQNLDSTDLNTLVLRGHHVTLSVKNLNAAVKWYEQKLGFTETRRVVMDDGNIQFAFMQVSGYRIYIAQIRGSVRLEDPNQVPNHLLTQGWRHVVLEVDDVDKAYKSLKARGVEFVGQPTTHNPPGIRVVYFKDLEGNVLELYKDI